MSIPPQAYLHSPVHHAVVIGDHKSLVRLLSALPKLSDPCLIHTEHDSITQEKLADEISSVVDRRDVPDHETPLHLSVRLNDIISARTLLSAGADVSLQNASGWNPLQEAICTSTTPEMGLTLLRFHKRSAWSKWRRRLPRLVQVLRRMPDFYMEISFHFESSIVPFLLGKVAPSDTYRIWKRGGNVRADTTLAGFDGLKIQRLDQSFLFLGDGDGDGERNLPCGSLLVINRDEGKIYNAFENAGGPMTESEIDEFLCQSSVYRPGIDVTKAQLVGRSNWRRQEKIESVGEWKAKVYEIHNVCFSFRSRKVSKPGGGGVLPPLELELDEEGEEGFLVAENPRYSISDGRRHSSFVREDREFIAIGRKSLDQQSNTSKEKDKEKEYVKSVRASVWLTQEFPLKTEELLPLLDILANKVKAVRRLRELLTTKFPPHSFPVKVSIPVVPTVKVVITFTKFNELQPPSENFYTPLSTPGRDNDDDAEEADDDDECFPRPPPPPKQRNHHHYSSWLRRNFGSKPNQEADPFAIPGDYEWASFQEKMPTKPRSIRKGKREKLNK